MFKGVSRLFRDKRPQSWNRAMACAASPVGGEDGPADVAVSGHGCQLPPDILRESRLLQPVLNNSYFA